MITLLGAVAVVFGCFAAGTFAAQRLSPTLADTRAGQIARWTVAGFFGAALAVVGVNLFAAIHIVHELHLASDDTQDSQVVVQRIHDALFYGGVLTAAAVGVQLLAPGADTPPSDIATPTATNQPEA
jgi:hypothetical protein